MNIKTTTFSTFMMFVPTYLSAQTLAPAEAQDIASAFFKSQTTSKGANKAPAVVAPVLAYTASTAGTPDFYVFNRAVDAPGFVIVKAEGSGDVIGYSPATTFDAANVPDNVSWWMQLYQQNGVAKVARKADDSRQSIEGLVTAKWNQNDPFNDYLSSFDDNPPFVAGCTSIAMTQIMKSYNYPTTGQGSKSRTVTYVTYDGQYQKTFAANFGATTYDWANMLDDYSNGYTSEQASAAALLVYHAGVANETTYNFSSSSADDRKSGQALIENFKYDKSMRHVIRRYYTDTQWDDMIYAELAAGRPIMYSGQSTGGGHSFVCHGYNAETRLYTINWGWGGLYDGEFALVGNDALNPHGAGIGGSTSGDGYVASQSVNINIMPDKGGSYQPHSAVRDELVLATAKGGASIANYDLDRASASNVTLSYRYTPYNPGFSPLSYVYGVEFRNAINGTTYYHQGGSTNNLASGALSAGSFYSKAYDMTFNTSILPYNGVYEMRPAYSVDYGETWQLSEYDIEGAVPTVTITGGADPAPIDLPVSLGSPMVQVGNSIAVVHSPYYTGSIHYASSNTDVAEVSAEGIVTGKQIGSATITVTADGDKYFLPTTVMLPIRVVEHFQQQVTFDLKTKRINVGETARVETTNAYDGAMTYEAVPSDLVSIAADGTITALAPGNVVIYAKAAGNYDFGATTAAFPLTVTAKPANTGGFDFAEQPFFGQNDVVNPGIITLNAKVVNHSAASMAPVYLYYSLQIEGSQWAAGRGFSELKAGNSGNISLKFDAPNAVPGKFYTIYFYKDNALSQPMNIPSLTFRVESESPSAGELTRVIDTMNQEGVGTLFDPEMLKAKILQQ